MRNFNLYLCVVDNYKLIGSSDTNTIQFETFDEQLDISENDQSTLTFSVITKSYQTDIIEHNPLLSFYFIGAKMKLEFNDEESEIDFIITSIAPETKNKNSVYVITAQDEVSCKWPRLQVGMNYRTETTEGLLTPKTIHTIADEVLTQSYLKDQGWSVDKSNESDFINETMSLEIEGSNPYAILIEACNTIQASLRVNYTSQEKKIGFYKQKTAQHSGYRYHPETTLQEYDSSGNGDELVTLLHVHGGTDANGKQITMVPEIPTTVRNAIITKYQQEQVTDQTLAEFLLTKNMVDFKYTYNDALNRIFLSQLVPKYVCIQESEDWDGGYAQANGIYKVNDYSYRQDYNNIYLTCNNDLFITISFDNNININSPYIHYKENYTIEVSNYPNILSITETGYFISNWFNTNLGNHLTLDIDKKDSDHPGHSSKCYGILIYDTAAINDMATQIQNTHNNYIDYIQYNPSLSNFILDLTMFQNYITDTLKNTYWELIQKCRAYNIQSQIYATEYYQIATEIMSIRSKIKTYMELYIVECKQNEYNAANTLIDLVDEYCNLLFVCGKSTELCTNSYTEYYDNLKSEYLTIINTLKQDLNQSWDIQYNKTDNIYELNTQQPTIISLKQKIQYYTEYVDTIITPVESYPGALCFVIQEIQYKIKELSEISNGVAYNYEQAQTDMENNFIKPLYANFSQYIYESTYENVEELDSISLYNQAIQYFADLNRIKTDHSLTVLDIAELEQISAPRLQIGNVISIYNEDSIKAQPYKSLIAALQLTNDADLTIKNNIENNIKDLYRQQHKINNNDPLYNELDDFYNTHYDILTKAYVVAEIEVIFLQLKDQNYLNSTKNINNISKLLQSIQNRLLTYLSTVGQAIYDSFSDIYNSFLRRMQSVNMNIIYDYIFNDEIHITGISYTLRTPIINNVTVQQNSRYKSILSKLIKSI